MIQYVEGAAKEAIEDYEGMGKGALDDALNVLKLRFGQPYLIVNACIGEVVEGDSITPGDAQGVQKLADKCQTVHNTLKTMECLDEINTDHMRRLVARNENFKLCNSVTRWCQALKFTFREVVLMSKLPW